MSPVSTLPGRLRLELEAIKGQRGVCDCLEGRIRTLPGVVMAAANFRTGRVLIQFEERTVPRTELIDSIKALLADPALCCVAPENAATRSHGRSGTSAKGLIFDLVAHAVLPKPFDILVPALSTLRR